MLQILINSARKFEILLSLKNGNIIATGVNFNFLRLLIFLKIIQFFRGIQ